MTPLLPLKTRTRHLISALLKNYKQAGMPQQAYALGIEYRDPKYWWIGTNINYLAETYIDVSHFQNQQFLYRILLADSHSLKQQRKSRIAKTAKV
jgi:hypothetical protein